MSDPSCGQPLGIFGGTFDPIHFGHLRLAEEAAEALDLAGIRWIPAGRPALRRPPRASARDRLTMVRLATSDNLRFEVDSCEVDTDAPSYSVSTLERLRRDDHCGPLRPLVLLVGADAFAGLPGWYRWEALFELAHVAVAHRPGFPLEPERLPPLLAECFRDRLCARPELLASSPSGRIVVFAMTPLAISATHIRDLLASHRSVRYLLPESVIAHIRRENFYLEC